MSTLLCSCLSQGFSNVAARFDSSRLRRSQGEEGAGGGRSPPPAPSSRTARLRAVLSEKTTFEKPWCLSCYWLCLILCAW